MNTRLKNRQEQVNLKGVMMFGAKSRLSSVLVVLLLAGLFCPVRVEAATSAAEKLMIVMPDEVVGFVATSGADELKPAFEKTIPGRIWNDPGVQTFYQSIRKELCGKVKEEMGIPRYVDVFFELGPLVLQRPIVIGAARKEAKAVPPVYGFAILDAGPRKAEIASAIAKVEALVGKGEIVEVEVRGIKMHGPKDPGGVPGYWGWVENYFVFAINDGEGLAVKYLTGRPYSRLVPDYFHNVAGAGDALAVYIDREKVFNVLSAIASMEGDTDEFNTVKTVIRELGLANIKTITARMGFAGPDTVCNELIRLQGPRTGLFGCPGSIELSMFDMADAGAMSATAVNCDTGGMYDTIMRAIKAASPDDAYPEINEGIARFEEEVKISIRKGLLESLAGPMVFYTLPAGVMMEAPSGGAVGIAKLKDAGLWEKTVTTLGKFATAESEGMVQVSSQVRDGRTFHCWVMAPLAMMQIMPTWTIVDNHVVIGSSIALCNKAAKQIVFAKTGAESLRRSEGFRKVATGLPNNLICFSYTNSRLQFNQMMIMLQQYWPMMTMVAGQQGIKLPFMLPSLGHIAEDMGPSRQYCWFDAEGLRCRYEGPGIEPSLAAIAGGGIGAAVLMPALARTRGLSHRVVSGSNLSGIGKTFAIYANDDDEGRYPPNLEKLVELDYITAKQLESPLKPRGFDGPSYIYISGHTAASHPGNIVAYDNPQFCDEGVNVLFVDGHVKWMEPEEFVRELKETYKRLGKEMPEIRFKGGRRHSTTVLREALSRSQCPQEVIE